MRLFALIAAAIIFTVAAFTGCSNSQSTQPAGVGKAGNTAQSNTRTPPDNVRRVTIAELRDAMEQGKAVAIDVRAEASYNFEHIKGALNIPEAQIASRAGELPKDKLIVLYCS